MTSLLQVAMANSRRHVRSLMYRCYTTQFDWDNPVWKHPILVASMSAQHARLNELESLAKTYASPPAPLDVSKYRQSIQTNRDLVDSLEAFYQKEVPNMALESEKIEEEDRLEDEAFLEQMQDLSSKYDELIQLWEREVELLQKYKVSRTTTLADLYMVYPEIAEELEDDMDEFNLAKDMGFQEK